MKKLTTEHIEAIRRYFLSANANEQSAIQNTIQPAYLSPFLLQLNEIFISKPDNDALISLLKSMDAADQLQALQQLQQDYYTHLALLHNAAIYNPDTEILIKSNNADFLNEINFQKELETAFLLNERADLKSKFAEPDNEGITPEDINLAFKLTERKQLKEQFQAIENENSTVIKPALPVIQFNWKRLAIAACSIGIILTSTFYLFDKKSNPSEISLVAHNKRQHIPYNSSDQQELNDILAANTIPFENKMKVLKDRSLGFAGNRDEKLTIRIDTLQTMISSINSAISRNIKDTSGLLKLKSDSLKNLENKYRFDNGLLSLYLPVRKSVKIYKTGVSYFMEINGSFYECKKTSKLLTLRKITDNAIKEKLEQIKSINLN